MGTLPPRGAWQGGGGGGAGQQESRPGPWQHWEGVRLVGLWLSWPRWPQRRQWSPPPQPAGALGGAGAGGLLRALNSYAPAMFSPQCWCLGLL